MALALQERLTPISRYFSIPAALSHSGRSTSEILSDTLVKAGHEARRIPDLLTRGMLIAGELLILSVPALPSTARTETIENPNTLTATFAWGQGANGEGSLLLASDPARTLYLFKGDAPGQQVNVTTEGVTAPLSAGVKDVTVSKDPVKELGAYIKSATNPDVCPQGMTFTYDRTVSDTSFQQIEAINTTTRTLGIRTAGVPIQIVPPGENAIYVVGIDSSGQIDGITEGNKICGSVTWRKPPNVHRAFIPAVFNGDQALYHSDFNPGQFDSRDSSQRQIRQPAAFRNFRGFH